jgi:hypothetical protein
MNTMPRKLRIGFSILCVIVCLSMVVLWLRSYWRLEILEKRTGWQAFQISSVKGRIAIAHLDPRTTIGRSYLSVAAGDAADWRKNGVVGAYYDDGLVNALIAPHWLPALLSAVLAGIPWILRSWRFSLRTLLSVTTLLAVLFGSMVYAIR